MLTCCAARGSHRPHSFPGRKTHVGATNSYGLEALRTPRPCYVTAEEFRVRRNSPLFDAVHKMHATAELNPYEREVMYGYPYVVGRLDGRAVRGPVLTIPVSITIHGDGYIVTPDDDIVRVNTLPFRTDTNTAARQLALDHLLDATPGFPLGADGAASFIQRLSRELPDVRIDTATDGRLIEPPSMPNSGSYLAIIEQAALFVAPKNSYFLASDLDAIGEDDDIATSETALRTLLSGAGSAPQAEFEKGADDSREIYYPFPSNRSQRRVALLVDHPETRVIRVEGPPGTGKSQTIANLACHLAAKGQTVLITSQKDQALKVVDEKLRGLGLPQIPMTLLRHDAASRRELRDRLDRTQKSGPASEAEEKAQALIDQFSVVKTEYSALGAEYASAIAAEREFVLAERASQERKGLRRLIASWRFHATSRRLSRNVPRATDEVAEEATELRIFMVEKALQVLRASLDRSISVAPRNERQQIREFSALLKRSPTSYKNFSIFDHLKGQPESAEMLLRILPIWILAPDDVARLFPAKPGLFDLVIVDEASQMDLPSIAPILLRGKKAVISGDTKQMQARTFAFMQSQVATEAWHRYGLKQADPQEWLNPLKQSLLTLAAVRAEEENLLDEHYRCLPPIIAFSNNRWYDNRLRVMTDETRKKFGGPERRIIELHYVEDGLISNGSQENQAEANAVVAKLKELWSHPGYAEATFGVVCLFEEQVRLIQDVVADEIEPGDWQAHDLVVVNPDGFQGDERDVVLYSLSFDNKIMSRAALSARQQDSEHIQGMLNVAFTRARDEMHIFHSAPIEDFGFADGSPGALTAWLAHCRTVESHPRVGGRPNTSTKSHSQFEADVADRLTNKGFQVTQQYPSCGFSIDMVVEQGGSQLALECDGEYWHHDEHGHLKVEDLERQAILERAGWEFIRVPYRRWRADPDEQLARVEAWFQGPADEEEDETDGDSGGGDSNPEASVTEDENAVLQALDEGAHEQDELFRRSRELLGYARLGNQIRARLSSAAEALEQCGLIANEASEYFLTENGRNTNYQVRIAFSRPAPTRRYSLKCADCGKKLLGGAVLNWDLKRPVRCSECGHGHRRQAADVRKRRERGRPVDPKWVDPDGKFHWSDGEAIIAFGMHKGRSLRKLVAAEPNYLNWMLSQDFSAEVGRIIKDAQDGEFPASPPDAG